MRMPRFRGRKPILAVAIVAAVVGLILGATRFFPYPWSRHSTFDVDINTGRIREVRFVGPFRDSEAVEETPLSQALPTEARRDVVPDWQTMFTLPSPSPSYGFMGTGLMIEQLESSWDCLGLDSSLRRKSALEVLGLWQLDHTNALARNYVASLSCEEGGKREIVHAMKRMEVPDERVEGGFLTRTYFYADGKPLVRVQGHRDRNGRFVPHTDWEVWGPDGRKE